MARRNNRGRGIDGVFVVDKPLGESSNKVLQIVKNIFAANKAGHTGSLDPLATGVLPICLGEATKFSQFLLDSDKTYLTTAKLGQTTTTGDAEGEVRDQKEVSTSEEEVEAVLERFKGVQKQTPSMFSAIKHNGQPLYKLAREGIEVERQAREIDIKALNLIDLSGDELRLEVSCSKGTYIRTLVEDIGEVLGCGAYVSALRRTQAGPYTKMLTIEELIATRDKGGHEEIDKFLMPMESSVTAFPEVSIASNQAYYLKQGQVVELGAQIERQFHQQENDCRLVRIFEQQAEPEVSMGKTFVGVGELSEEGNLQAKRLLKTN